MKTTINEDDGSSSPIQYPELAREIRNAFVNVNKDPVKILLVLFQLIKALNINLEDENEVEDEAKIAIDAVIQKNIILTKEQIYGIRNIIVSLEKIETENKKYYEKRYSLEINNMELMSKILKILKIIFYKKCKWINFKEHDIVNHTPAFARWPESTVFKCNLEAIFENQQLNEFCSEKAEQAFINWIKAFMDKLFWYVLTHPIDQGLSSKFELINNALAKSYDLLGCEERTESYRDRCVYDKMLDLISYVYKNLPEFGEHLVIPGMKSLNEELSNAVNISLEIRRNNQIDKIIEKYRPAELTKSDYQAENNVKFIARCYKNNYKKSKELTSNNIREQILDMPFTQFTRYLNEKKESTFVRAVNWFLNTITFTIYNRRRSNTIRTAWLKELENGRELERSYELKSQLPMNAYFTSRLFVARGIAQEQVKRQSEGQTEIVCPT